MPGYIHIPPQLQVNSPPLSPSAKLSKIALITKVMTAYLNIHKIPYADTN
jgi:hypothetical protein